MAQVEVTQNDVIKKPGGSTKGGTYHVLFLLTLSLCLGALLTGALSVRPALAAAPGVVECPANGVGPVKELRDTIGALGQMVTYDAITINVTGAQCVFTLTDAVMTTTAGPVGLPVILHNTSIRAVGGRAVIERAPNVKEFRLIESNAKLTLENLTLAGGAAKYNFSPPGSGGAIFANQPLTLTNVVITGNVSYRGGGVYVEGPVVMDHVNLLQNRTQSAAPSDGGALYVAGNLTATQIRVLGNAANDCGCGSDQARGGGIYVSGNALIDNSDFRNNSTNRLEGGGLYVTGALTLTKSSFFDNRAGFTGGGVYVAGSLMLSDTDFISNFAASDGGGLYGNGAVFVTDTRFISNTAEGTGGGLAAGSLGGGPIQKVIVQGSEFISNFAMTGGGLGIQAGVVQNNFFQQNIVKSFTPVLGGGGLAVFLQGTVQGNRFISNTAPTGGGAQILYYPPNGSSADSNVSNNVFIDNEATANNGAAVAAGLNVDAVQGDFAQINHNTVVQHKHSNASALYFARSSADVANNIITSYRIGIQVSDAGVTSNGNLFDGATANYVGINGGAQDATADPLFADENQGNYHLKPTSPARDSGVDAGVTVDFDGVARPQGKGFDRGAFEFINHAPLAEADVYTTSVATPLDIAAFGVLANDGDGDGDALTAAVATPVLHGSLMMLETGGFVYTPSVGFSGDDFFFYRAGDGIVFSEPVRVTIHVVEGGSTPPAAIAGLEATYSGTTVAGRTVNFAATVAAGSNVRFAWDFGDGATGSGPTVSHVYKAAGVYAVTLTAGNSLGTKQAAITVTVQAVQGEGQKARLVLPLVSR